MSERIVVTSPKGGVGKTTVALHLGLALAERGMRTLIVDLDPQGGIGLSLAKRDGEWRGLVDVLAGEAQCAEVVVRTNEPRLAILPRGRLDPIEVPSFEDAVRTRGALDALLRPIEDAFDRVILDTPSGLGGITRAALGAADWALVVFKAEPLAMRSIQQVLRVIEHVREGERPELSLLGIVPTMVELSKEHSQSSMVALWTELEGVLDAAIPRSDALARASQLGVPVSYLGGRLPPEARRFAQLADEIEGVIHASRRGDGIETREQRALV
ncbi:ParA family protein [Sandaracinus amylolyticus]|uniref:ParA family protein n=1 Tax=Sandaracinus amylolyticus TaxID=927083 RepID=UPI001F30E48B|nr:ParA family protein [Sandaracinus amylolyticus]UJR85385.1 Hypothetical protein I5071_74650 [Sandaracinus amylolyticus]